MNCSIVYIFLTVYTWLYVSVFIHLLILSLIYTSIPSMSVSVSLEHCCVVYTILGTEGTVQSTCSEEVSGIVTVNYIIELPTQKENELREYIAHRLILKEWSPIDICKVVKYKVIYVNSVIFFFFLRSITAWNPFHLLFPSPHLPHAHKQWYGT